MRLDSSSLPAFIGNTVGVCVRTEMRSDATRRKATLLFALKRVALKELLDTHKS